MQTIKVILAESGRVANLKKDFPLYVGSYQNKLLNVLVPKSILAPNFTSHYIDTDGVVKSVDGAYTAVKIGMTYLERTGVIKQSTTFFMRYLKDVIINNVEYSMYERLLPKEFTLFEGQGENAPKLIVNIVNVLVETKIDDENIESIGTTLEVITSQYASIDVMYSADLNNEPEYNPSDMELLSAIVNSHIIDVETSLKNSSDALETSINADNKATEALSKAEDALNTVVSDKGTSVYVNNQAQPRLDFETDPQNQINNVKKDAATLQTNKADKTTVEALQTQANENTSKIEELETNKADKTMLPNPNLLINGDFRVNQRGASGTQNGNAKFPVDRWKTAAVNAFCTTNLDTNGNVESVTVGITSVTTSGGRNALIYNFEDKDFKELLGKQVTLSVSYENLVSDVANSVRIRFDSGVDNGSKVLTETSGIAILTFTVNQNATQLVIQIAGTSSALNYSLKLNWAKLELGSVATTFSPRPYAEELALCQRYGIPISLHGSVGAITGDGVTMDVSVPIPTTLRQYHSLTNIGLPTIRGNGAYNIDVSSITYNGLDKNRIILKVTASTSLTKHSLYMLYYGSLFIDAEI